MTAASYAQTAKLDGISMDYMTFGNGKKQLVILPGLSIRKATASGPMLKNTYKMFIEEFTITVLDRNDLIAPGYSIHDMAEETVQVLGHLGIEKACFISASQGGMILQDILVNHPSMVQKGVFGSTVARINEDKKPLPPWGAMAKAGKKTELIENMLDTIFSESFLKKHRNVLIAMFQKCTQTELNRFAILSDACPDYDLYGRLKQLCTNKSDYYKKNMLVLGAKGDQIFPAECILELADVLSCEYYLYGSEYGHAVYDEAPDYYERAYEFLK